MEGQRNKFYKEDIRAPANTRTEKILMNCKPGLQLAGEL